MLPETMPTTALKAAAIYLVNEITPPVFSRNRSPPGSEPREQPEPVHPMTWRDPPTRVREVGSASHMKAQVAPLEGNKVKLSIEVEESEVEKAIDETFAKFAKELRVPGFRPGKTPRPVLEARIGKPAVRQQALEDNIPVWYDRAVRDKAVDIIDQAEIEVTSGRDAGPLAFDAVVDVRPQLNLVGYESLKVTRAESSGDRARHPGPGRPAEEQLRGAGARRAGSSKR